MSRSLTFFAAVTLTFLASCVASEQRGYPELTAAISGLQELYAPDKRTDRVEVLLAGDTLKGYTTRPEALDSLVTWLVEYPQIFNAVRLLPAAQVGEQNAGIINVAVANLRSKPGHSQELATQALLGTPIEVLDKENGWCLVRTPDRYIAWLEPGAFVAMTPEQAAQWMDGDTRIYVGASGEILAAPGKGRIISTVVQGSILEFYPELSDPKFTMVRLPDGVTGWLPKGELLWPPAWWRAKEISVDALLAAAQVLAGRPYLWGGTSPNGMDCSGFTKMSYYLNGFVIPRDASQQVHAGTDVALTKDLANLQAGDQLFFGSYREDGSEKITHTGFYLGDGRFLHAGADNGRIKENSLLPADEDFAEHRLKSLLRARRLSAGTDGVVPVAEAFKALLGKGLGE